MTIKDQKVSSEERRELILQKLRQSNSVYTGAELAQTYNVTRQVIVKDIALLRAAKHPIVATPQGYVYQTGNDLSQQRFIKVIPVQHPYEQTELELYTMVDHGLTVLDVIVEHPIYGEITGGLRLKSRRDVNQFIESIEKKKAYLLSSLTDGIHLHTVEAEAMEDIDEACKALAKLGILLEDI